MTHRSTLAVVLLAALSVPAAAQQATQPDTSKKGVTTTTSPGAIADPAPPATANPNAAAPSTVAPSPGATVTTPNSTAPSSMAPTTPPSTGATVTTPAPTSGNAANTPSGVTAGATNPAAAAEGQVQPTSGAIKVDVKVDPSLANTAKISADSAFALARASNTAGEISSAELEMTDKRLVYQVKMVKGAGASTVYVDAMTGEVVKDKKFGGLKAAAENQEEAKKLYDAKKDETKKDDTKKAP